jgi:hypothetical protein
MQMPFYGITNLGSVGAGDFFVAIAGLVADGAGIEELVSFMIPQGGTLGTMLVKNIVAGDDAVNCVYQARKKGVDVGDPVTIGNNAIGPVKVDLSDIPVAAGDWVTIAVTVPTFGGAPPVPKCVFTWIPSASAP